MWLWGVTVTCDCEVSHSHMDLMTPSSPCDCEVSQSNLNGLEETTWTWRGGLTKKAFCLFKCLFGKSPLQVNQVHVDFSSLCDCDTSGSCDKLPQLCIAVFLTTQNIQSRQYIVYFLSVALAAMPWCGTRAVPQAPLQVTLCYFYSCLNKNLKI